MIIVRSWGSARCFSDPPIRFEDAFSSDGRISFVMERAFQRNDMNL